MLTGEVEGMYHCYCKWLGDRPPQERTTATTTSKIEFSNPTLVSGLHKIAGPQHGAYPPYQSITGLKLTSF